MNNDERIDLINRVASWAYDNTESFQVFNVGSDLAYLLWAVAAGTGVDSSAVRGIPTTVLEKTLKKNPNGLWDALVEKGVITV